MKVQSLIIHDNKVWHDDLLQQLFHTNEIQQIKSIPLININYNDTQIWKLTYDVNYIVRSTYHFIMDFLYHDESNKVPSKWKQLWSLKYPTKIQAPHLENSKRFPTYKSETTFKRSTMPIHLCFLEKQPGKQLVSTLWLWYCYLGLASFWNWPKTQQFVQQAEDIQELTFLLIDSLNNDNKCNKWTIVLWTI